MQDIFKAQMNKLEDVTLIVTRAKKHSQGDWVNKMHIFVGELEDLVLFRITQQGLNGGVVTLYKYI